MIPEGIQRDLLIKAARNSLYFTAGVLRMPLVDFKWPLDKYEGALAKLDQYRSDGQFTDEEIGDTFEELAVGQQRLIAFALNSVAGLLKSKLIDFVVSVEKFDRVFECLNEIRVDRFLEDEELANFCCALGDALDKL